MSESEARSIALTYRYRVYPSRRQHADLSNVLEQQRELYNAAIEERDQCYRKTGRTITWIDQFKSLTECRRCDEGMAGLPANIQRFTLARVEDAYTQFFKAVNAGGVRVYPKPRERMSSFGFSEWVGIRIVERGVRIKGISGVLRVGFHRLLPAGSAPKACTFKLDGKRWFVCIRLWVPVPEKRPALAAVGLDIGLKTLATLSNGDVVNNIRPNQTAERDVRRLRRSIARRKKGSNQRRKAVSALRRRIARTRNVRRTHLHQSTRRLLRSYDLIAIEALNVEALSRTFLGKWVRDASWGEFVRMLRYKSAKFGVTIVEVDPRRTSQECPGCGALAPKTLAERVHSCPCGCVLDRDIAAAKIVLKRAVAGPRPANVAQWGERGAGTAEHTTSVCHQPSRNKHAARRPAATMGRQRIS